LNGPSPPFGLAFLFGILYHKNDAGCWGSAFFDGEVLFLLGFTMSNKKEIEIRKHHDERWQPIRHSRLYNNFYKEYKHLRRGHPEAAHDLELEMAAEFGLMVPPPHPEQTSLIHIPRPFLPAVCIIGQDGGFYYIGKYLSERDEPPRGAIAIPQLPEEADALLSILFHHGGIPRVEPDILSYPQRVIQAEESNLYEFIRRLKSAAGIPSEREPSSETLDEAFRALELHRAGKTDMEIGELLWPKEHAVWVNRFGLRKEEELAEAEHTKYSERLGELLGQPGLSPDEAEKMAGREFRLISSNPRKRNYLEKKAQRRYKLALKRIGDK